MRFPLYSVLLLVYSDYSTANIYLQSCLCCEDCQIPDVRLAVYIYYILCCTAICCVERLDGAASLKHP